MGIFKSWAGGIMKCKKCDIELEGNECPRCCAKAEIEQVLEKETIIDKVGKVLHKKGRR